MSLADVKTQTYIQNKIGGSIRLRSGAKAIRWRLHNKTGMINQINLVNGHIRHTGRLKQQHHIITHLNINIETKTPISLTIQNKWFAGFFDADGTITYSFKGINQNPQLTISVTNKQLIDIEQFKKFWGGSIYFDISKNGYYKWMVQSRDDILRVQSYLLNAPIRSFKLHRLHLINRYFELIDLNAHKAEKGTILAKSWLIFIEKWNKGR